MSQYPSPPHNTRIGFHYFPDTLHYRSRDLSAWLPELKALGAKWLTLVAPHDRAIPEDFIRGLLKAGIEPILHFHIPLDAPPKAEELALFFKVYKEWGVNYVALFNKPNCHSQWPDEKWIQKDLVERFLDIYLPLAETVLKMGLFPVFPPLEPGGDFWDTAFLRTALESIERRGHDGLLEKLVIGAYAWADNLPLNWGAGGPERWPGARPYYTPLGEEDQIGFRIFDWYTTITQAAIGKTLPIILLAGGSRPDDRRDPKAAPISPEMHASKNLKIAKLLAGEELEEGGKPLSKVPSHVLAGNFWLLAASPEDKHAPAAWYQADGTTLPAVDSFKTAPKTNGKSAPIEPEGKFGMGGPASTTQMGYKPIDHYLLLPTYEWGVSNWHLEVIQPFVQKHQPTVGFVVEEACNARKVTMVGGKKSFSPDIIEKLRASGAIVEQIDGDGTSIATQLGS